MGDSYKTPRIEVACDICGQPIFKTPYQYNKVAHHYCSRKCAGIAKSQEMAGSNNPNWKGGSIDSRGPNWSVTREQTRIIHNNQCADCGMTNDEHLGEYGKDLHVHHKVPYRLTQDNSPNNLEPLCIPCHIKKEKLFDSTLTPLEKALMEHNTNNARNLGMDKRRVRTVPCPICNGRKTPRSKTCKKCWVKNHPRRLPPKPPKYCIDCGVEIALTSTTCRACHFKRIKKPEPGTCPNCGEQMLFHRSKRCRPCTARINGRNSKGPGKDRNR
jgi:hypothetical protein